MIVKLALNDCRTRFAGSFLGGLWAFAGPVVTMVIYWFVYTVALKGRSIDGVPYFPWLISGILPWFFFVEATALTTTAFRDYSFLVTKIRFKSEYLPLIRVISAVFVHIVLLLAVYLTLSVMGIEMKYGQALVLLWLLGGFLFCLGLGKILGLWCVRNKDLAYAVPVALQLGFWITPVFWNAEGLPEGIRQMFLYNPIAILVNGYRKALLLGELPSNMELLVFGLFVIVLNALGCYLIKREGPTIADHL